MYYNGYIIICIFIGSYLGYFVFGWETLVVGEACVAPNAALDIWLADICLALHPRVRLERQPSAAVDLSRSLCG